VQCGEHIDSRILVRVDVVVRGGDLQVAEQERDAL
jgi:hypothetical protein